MRPPPAPGLYCTTVSIEGHFLRSTACWWRAEMSDSPPAGKACQYWRLFSGHHVWAPAGTLARAAVIASAAVATIFLISSNSSRLLQVQGEHALFHAALLDVGAKQLEHVLAFAQRLQHDHRVGLVGRPERDRAEREDPLPERLVELVIVHAVELELVDRLVEHALAQLQPLGRELVLDVAQHEPFPDCDEDRHDEPAEERAQDVQRQVQDLRRSSTPD